MVREEGRVGQLLLQVNGGLIHKNEALRTPRPGPVWGLWGQGEQLA